MDLNYCSSCLHFLSTGVSGLHNKPCFRLLIFYKIYPADLGYYGMNSQRREKIGQASITSGSRPGQSRGIVYLVLGDILQLNRLETSSLGLAGTGSILGAHGKQSCLLLAPRVNIYPLRAQLTLAS